MSKVDAKIFKVRFEAEKFQSVSRPKNFKVLEAEKFQSVLRPEKFQSGLRPINFSKSRRSSDLEAGQKFSKYSVRSICPCQVEIRFPVSELGPRVAQRAQVAEVSTYYNAVWQC